MYRLTTAASFIILSCLLGSASCEDEKQKPPAKSSCEGVICTMMFAAVAVQVQDAEGQPVILDSTRTLNASGALVHKGVKNYNGSYTVVDDSYREKLAMRTESFTFVGYIGGQEVVQGMFSISADCCHVSRSGGPEVLTLK